MKPRLFAEIPAGLASLSLVLQGGKHCKPPVSRMGNKAGYALPILDAMGLHPGQGAESYLWCEADPDVRALLCAYPQPELLRAVAEVLRGWVGEEPRALWTRLRDERRARVTRAAVPEDYQVAEWMFLHHGSYCYKGVGAGIGRPEGNPGESGFGVVRPSRDIVEDAALRLAAGPGWPPVAVTSTAPTAGEIAGWLAFVTHDLKSGGFAAEHIGSPGNRRPADLPVARTAALASVIWPPTAVTSRAPSAEELAGWLFRVGNSWRGDGDHWRDPSAAVMASGVMANRSARGLGSDVGIVASINWPPTAVTSAAPSAEELAGWVISAAWSYEQGNVRTGFCGPGDRRQYTSAVAVAVDRLAEVSARPNPPTPGVDLEGCVVYMDPPYVGTTGYGVDLPRAEVVRLALEYAAAGALVVVSEATPIPELTALGWEAVDIAGERRGQKRSFSKDQGRNEWITMSKAPVHRPSTQASLFALGGL